MERAAVTLTDLRNRLADLINELIKSTGIVISPADIDLTHIPATAALNRSGTNGHFDFSVTPPNTAASAYNDGTIVATANDEIGRPQGPPLQAWTQNVVLHVSGLIECKLWYIYNLLLTDRLNG